MNWFVDTVIDGWYDFWDGQYREFPNHPILGTVAELVLGTAGLYAMMFLACL